MRAVPAILMLALSAVAFPAAAGPVEDALALVPVSVGQPDVPSLEQLPDGGPTPPDVPCIGFENFCGQCTPDESGRYMDCQIYVSTGSLLFLCVSASSNFTTEPNRPGETIAGGCW